MRHTVLRLGGRGHTSQGLGHGPRAPDAGPAFRELPVVGTTGRGRRRFGGKGAERLRSRGAVKMMVVLTLRGPSERRRNEGTGTWTHRERSGRRDRFPLGHRWRSHGEEARPCQGAWGLECPAQLRVHLAGRTGPTGHRAGTWPSGRRPRWPGLDSARRAAKGGSRFRRRGWCSAWTSPHPLPGYCSCPETQQPSERDPK